MQAHMPSLHTCPAPRVESKGRFLLKVVMLNIKLKGMEHRAQFKHIFCPYIPSKIVCDYIRKYHNNKLQTTPLHQEEEPALDKSTTRHYEDKLSKKKAFSSSRWGQKIRTVLFAEYWHGAYQIKGNRTQSIMHTHTLDPLGGVKGQINCFPKVVMLRIKFMGMEHREPGWGQRVKTFLSKVVVLHFKLKGVEYSAPCKNVLCPYTLPLPRIGV